MLSPINNFAFYSSTFLQDLQGTGFHVEPDVINRLHPNEQTTITVTAKQEKEGDANVLVTAFVSGSLSYQITLRGKFVVPDLHFYTDTLEFGSIKRGRESLRNKNTLISTQTGTDPCRHTLVSFSLFGLIAEKFHFHNSANT